MRGKLLLGVLLISFSGFVYAQEGKVNRQRWNRLLFSQIETDLEPWKDKGITLEQVERTYCTTFEGGHIDGGFRLQIVAGEMFVAGELVGYPDFNRYVKLFLLDVARHHKLPDVDLVLSTSDKCHPGGKYRGSSKKCPFQAPLFSYAKRREDEHCVLFPDHTFAGWPTVHLPSWQDVWELMETTQQPRWEDRMDKLYFRGALTGNRLFLQMDQNFTTNPHVDVNFSRWTGDENGTFASLPEHCNFKYLLHLPGQAYSSRIKNLFLCKAPVIFSADGTREFWYHLLQDGDNVMFVKELTYKTNGSEILKALDLLRADNARAQILGLRGHELGQRAGLLDFFKNLLLQDYRYFAQLLTAYAALQKFTVQKHVDAVPMAISALSPDRNTTMAGRTCSVCEA